MTRWLGSRLYALQRIGRQPRGRRINLGAHGGNRVQPHRRELSASDLARADVRGERMPEDQFTFVHAGTLGEPLNMEVRKAGLTIGRILHLGEIFEFHKGISSALNESAQYSDLEELKKWIRETQ
jgi:hypothetical protein